MYKHRHTYNPYTNIQYTLIVEAVSRKTGAIYYSFYINGLTHQPDCRPLDAVKRVWPTTILRYALHHWHKPTGLVELILDAGRRKGSLIGYSGNESGKEKKKKNTPINQFRNISVFIQNPVYPELPFSFTVINIDVNLTVILNICCGVFGLLMCFASQTTIEIEMEVRKTSKQHSLLLTFWLSVVSCILAKKMADSEINRFRVVWK